MQAIINSECLKCCPLAFDKGLLAPLVYRLVNNGLFKVHQSLLPGHVMYWLLVCSCMQPRVLYCTVLRCGLIGDHKSSEMKSGVSWRRTGTSQAHCPAGNLFKHNLRELLLELKLCTSYNVDIETFWWLCWKWHMFLAKINCWTCAVDRRTV